MEYLFRKYQLLIHHQARKWHFESNFDYDELVLEGYLVFCECYRSWDRTKQFSRWLVCNLNYRFQGMILNKRQGGGRKYTDIMGAVGDMTWHKRCDEFLGLVADQMLSYDQLIENFPDDCKMLVRIVLENEIKSLASLSFYLRRRGWKWKAIKTRIKQVKQHYEENKI